MLVCVMYEWCTILFDFTKYLGCRSFFRLTGSCRRDWGHFPFYLAFRPEACLIFKWHDCAITLLVKISYFRGALVMYFVCKSSLPSSIPSCGAGASGTSSFFFLFSRLVKCIWAIFSPCSCLEVKYCKSSIKRYRPSSKKPQKY